MNLHSLIFENTLDTNIQDSDDGAIRVLTTIDSYFKTFQMAEAPFLASVEATLGERYTPQMDTIYHVIAGSTKEQKYFQIIF